MRAANFSQFFYGAESYFIFDFAEEVQSSWIFVKTKRKSTSDSCENAMGAMQQKRNEIKRKMNKENRKS